MFVGIDPDMGDVGFCKIHDPPDDIVKGSVARDTMYRGVWGIGFPLTLLNHRVAWVCADDKSKGRMDLACFLENVQISCFNIPPKQTLRSIFAGLYP